MIEGNVEGLTAGACIGGGLLAVDIVDEKVIAVVALNEAEVVLVPIIKIAMLEYALPWRTGESDAVGSKRRIGVFVCDTCFSVVDVLNVHV